MKRSIFYALLLGCLILVCLSGVTIAQGELTIETLNERLQAVEAALADLPPALAARVESLESKFADPWSPDAVSTEEGICQSPLHMRNEYSVRSMDVSIHQETADAYRAAFGQSIDANRVSLASISFATEGSNVYLEFHASGQNVFETWAQCEYLGHSEWYAP